MSRREALVSAAIVFGVALGVRIWAAGQVVFPQPEDTAYYVAVARNLLEGRGLVADALWSYQTEPLSFPRPAFEVWLPLPTILAALPMAILGTTFKAAQLSAVIAGAIVPVLAWRLGADVAIERGLSPGRVRMLALGIGLTAAFYLPLVLFSALPDSTMPFAVLALGACLVMTRAARRAETQPLDVRWLVALGVLIGLAALTRNEAVWLGLVWLVIVWRTPGMTLRKGIRLVGTVGVVAAVVFAPWAVRNWLTFGSPLPGQAAANAFSVTGFDIFAWNDPPTLSRYLAVGPARLAEMRLEGLWHNLYTVLLAPGSPVAALGLLALAWQVRERALRPLVLLAALTFAVTSLAFPVATTWGTFLHAAGPVHVLLVVSCLGALDAAIARAGIIRGWTRPVAWLGAAFGVAASALFAVSFMPATGAQSAAAQEQYAAIERRMAEVGEPLGRGTPRAITNFPIWLADSTGTEALALPAEPPDSVLDLARHFGATRLIFIGTAHDEWPGVLETAAPGAECFEEVPLDVSADDPDAESLEDVRVFRIVCP